VCGAGSCPLQLESLCPCLILTKEMCSISTTNSNSSTTNATNPYIAPETKEGVPMAVIIGGVVGLVVVVSAVAWWCGRRSKHPSQPSAHDMRSSDLPLTSTLQGDYEQSITTQTVFLDAAVSENIKEEEARRLREEEQKMKPREEVHVSINPVQAVGSNYSPMEKHSGAPAGEPNHVEVVPHIPFSDLAVDNRPLAAGSFKTVYKATLMWANKDRQVALLVLRQSDRAAVSDMKNEIQMFSVLGKHRHLALLLATCTQPQSGDMCMVMEFAQHGSLDHVLMKAAEDGQDVSKLVLIAMGMQVAEGITHLHLHDIVHRDLAVRNILVFQFDSQDWKRVLLKVTDYGLSLLANGYAAGLSVVEISTKHENTGGPTRWMAPESLLRRVYSAKTDVWSLGVLLYEILTLGVIPYHDITDDREVARVVLAGERLPRPDKCSDQVYAIMQNCWQGEPRDRPGMAEIQTQLHEALAQEIIESSKPECVVCLNAGEALESFLFY
jgi:hypothetical protein